MGTYPPRECGIATFTRDLLKSSQQFLGKGVVCKVVAMNLSTLETYTYPSEVEWQLDQNDKEEYVHLANRINKDEHISGVVIQHEYGIYGGVDGGNILEFIEACTKPMVVTLHTVLPNPSKNMKRVTEKIIKRASAIVVLTYSSKTILTDVYPASLNKVHVVPHGIHPTKFEDTTDAKKQLGLVDKTILSTFGLLSRGKGIEYVLHALPKVISVHPSVLYLILGETHPLVRRAEGESYRKELTHLVTTLHLKKHVRFYDQYLSLRDLLEFLKATDIYISTSINPNQAVSGTLSYALGTGRAVISTAFPQASEVVTADVGKLVPIKNSNAYTTALLSLLHDKGNVENMHKAAYHKTRPMLWGNVALEYLKLLSQNVIPALNLSHLVNMTDGFGMFQFAKFNVPDKQFGYTLDDNARALVVCARLNRADLPKVDVLVGIYLKFIETCQRPYGGFINYINHNHKKPTIQNMQEDLEDSTARALWALSEVVTNREISFMHRTHAEAILLRALPLANNLSHKRALAYAIKALATMTELYPKRKAKLVASIRQNADLLVKALAQNSIKSWHWFDAYLGYNNGIMPEALLIAGRVTNTQSYIDLGLDTLIFLIDKTFSENKYMPIGHSHWYKNKEKRSNFDQQPEDPASMIMALVTALEITHDEQYRKLIDVCFSWFLGNNSLNLPLYNYYTGGCFDGLHPDRVNQNQGAESLVSYMLSLIAVTKLNNNENSTNNTYLS